MGFLTKIASILKRSGKEGQHTIEYAVLMILVMAGIITMSRYVIRSWNANLKGWEDSAIDSMEDPLIQVDPPSLPSCTPEGFTPIGCGLGVTNVCTGVDATCAPTDMTFIQTYNPGGCYCSDSDACGAADTDDCIVQCAPDPCCCDTDTLAATGCGTTPGNTAPPACTSTGLSPPPCASGDMGYSINCGGTTYYGCEQDSGCALTCPATVLPIGAGLTEEFPRTPEGQTAILNCPIGYTGGPPARDCLIGGTWDVLQNRCVAPCQGTWDIGTARLIECVNRPPTPLCGSYSDVTCTEGQTVRCRKTPPGSCLGRGLWGMSEISCSTDCGNSDPCGNGICEPELGECESCTEDCKPSNPLCPQPGPCHREEDPDNYGRDACYCLEPDENGDLNSCVTTSTPAGAECCTYIEGNANSWCDDFNCTPQPWCNNCTQKSCKGTHPSCPEPE